MSLEETEMYLYRGSNREEGELDVSSKLFLGNSAHRCVDYGKQLQRSES